MTLLDWLIQFLLGLNFEGAVDVEIPQPTCSSNGTLQNHDEWTRVIHPNSIGEVASVQRDEFSAKGEYISYVVNGNDKFWLSCDVGVEKAYITSLYSRHDLYCHCMDHFDICKGVKLHHFKGGYYFIDQQKKIRSFDKHDKQKCLQAYSAFSDGTHPWFYIIMGFTILELMLFLLIYLKNG